jgi:flagellin-like protein
MDCLSLIPLRTNRKGLSEVIATLLIILLTVALVAVLAQVIIPFIKSSLNKSTECLGHREYFTFQEVYNYKNADLRYNCYTNNLTGFSVKAGIDEENGSVIAGFDLVLLEEGNSKKLNIRNGVLRSSDLRMLNSSTPIIAIPAPGETRTYVHEKQAGENQFISMEVYPVLKSGRVCEMSDEIRLDSCATTELLNL